MGSWLEALFNFFTGGENISQTPPKKHIFTVETSEGEVCQLDTSDRSSPFYGRSWEKVLTAYENKEFLRGRAITRCMSRDNRFSGYSVRIEGIDAFLPASKASWFHEPEHDACGKYIALSIESIYTNGGKAGKIIVNAYEPIKFLNRRQNKSNYNMGALLYAIAIDYDRAFLIFPCLRDQLIYVSMNEAADFAIRKGLGNNPEMFTGWCWQLRIINKKANQILASPVDILTD